MAESGYDPKAVSKKGALGLMQLMPGTADELELEDPFDPFHNVNAGVKYLKGLLNEFEGDLELAIAAYNAGSKKVREFNGIPPYKTTRNYVKKVFQYYRYYQNSKV
jgi:soluble lytic murein transglycosylase-like protein